MENISLNSTDCSQKCVKADSKTKQPKVPIVNLETKADSYELSSKEPVLVNIDPDDVYVKEELQSTDSAPKNFIGSAKLGASVKPTQIIKWGGRLWAAAEIYDTLDAYYERIKNFLEKKGTQNS